MSDLSPMYRIENILARHNSRKPRGAPLRVSTVARFLLPLPLPQSRLVVSSLGRIRIVNSPMLTLLCLALLVACADEPESTTLLGSAVYLADLPIWGFGMFSRLTGVKWALGSLAFL